MPYGSGEELSVDERVARQVASDTDRIARQIAANRPRPTGAERVSDERELELWLQKDPSVDEQALWAQHLQAGTDPWVARTDVANRLYPNRSKMMPVGRPKVQQQIDWANGMAKKAEARLAKRADEQRVRDGMAGLGLPAPESGAPASIVPPIGEHPSEIPDPVAARMPRSVAPDIEPPY